MRFSLFLMYFSVSFIFGYLAWPHFRVPFFIFTIVMFRGVLEILHTHLGFIFPKVLPMFISHYSVFYILGRIFIFLHSRRIFFSIHTLV
jgi:hypothetical protein